VPGDAHLSRDLEELLGSEDVAEDERGWIEDGPVVVALRSEIDHPLHAVLSVHPLDGLGVVEIGPDEVQDASVYQGSDGGVDAGGGEVVQANELEVWADAVKVSGEIASDKPSNSGD